jgi:hypothetical protein
MDDYHLTSADLSSLKEFHRTLQDKRQAYRVNAVILYHRLLQIGLA